MRSILFTAMLFMTMGNLIAQDESELKPFSKAERNFHKELFKEALFEYTEAIKTVPKTELALFHMEICSLLTDYRSKSIDFILSQKNTLGKTDGFYHYWLGRVYFRRYNFPKAIESWQNFLKHDSYKSVYIQEETKVYIEWAELAIAFYKDFGDIRVEHLPSAVNNIGNQYSPLFLANSQELLFISEENNSEGSKNYYVYKTTYSDAQWSSPSIISSIGKIDAKNTQIDYSNKKQRAYFFKGEYAVGLNYSKKGNNGWAEPLNYEESLPIHRLESCFYIDENETIIVFGVNKKVKPFDMDLYVTRKEKGKWIKPYLFSEKVTSFEDENFPYLSKDGKTLYFSSRGFGTIGGYDIFKSTYDNSKNDWSEPIQLKYPLNSTDDDIQYRHSDNGKEGFLVSDRFGTVGSYDLFHFKNSINVLLDAIVYNEKEEPLENIHVEISAIGYDPGTVNLSSDKDGKFAAKLNSGQQFDIKFFYEDEMILSQTLEVPSEEDHDKVITKKFKLTLAPSTPEKEILIQSEVTQYEDLASLGSKFRRSHKALIPNIYFDFDTYYLSWDKRPNLDPLVATLKENPTVKIEIAGHTDSVGGAKQNERISFLRANSVAIYLIEQGIGKNRIVVKGYGESKPLATNDDEKEGRELNRRTEVVVIE